MNHYIYKITDLETNQYYIGMRSSNIEPELDSYMGSGDWIKSHRKQYGKYLQRGKTRFIKEIIEYCGSRKELAYRENIILGDIWKNNIMCMNKINGGYNGLGEGVNNPRYDPTIYRLWDHNNQKELLITKNMFAKTYNQNLCHLLAGRCKSTCGVVLYENKDRKYGYKLRTGDMHIKHDIKKYHLWDHKEQKELLITKSDFKIMFKTDLWKLLNGKRKSVCGLVLHENRHIKIRKTW